MTNTHRRELVLVILYSALSNYVRASLDISRESA
jgi:hypothetical protein